MIRLFALDIDGTLTDGCVYMDGKGGELKRFNIQDGLGLVMLMRSGVRVAFISGRYSPATQQRADDLKISACINGTSDKLAELKKLADGWNIAREEVAYAGDDIPDLECVRWAGLGMTLSNGRDEMKSAASWVSPCAGGFGGIRDCAEKILEINGVKK